jgi:polyhydroxyalkanoate synthase subunit PhaC
MVGGHRVRPKNITYPVLNVVAERDDIEPLAAATPILGLVGSADLEEIRLHAGHVAIDWLDRHSNRLVADKSFP